MAKSDKRHSTQKSRKKYPALTPLVVIFVICYVVFSLGYNLGQRDSSGKKAEANDSVAPVHILRVSDIDVYELWSLTNKTRLQNGLSELSLSPLLNKSAAAKCHDMAVKKYWDHQDPSGRQPWHFITEAGINYNNAGENLADNFDSAQAVFNGWMNSKEHKDNILDSDFGRVGFSVCEATNIADNLGGTLVTVQHFTN